MKGVNEILSAEARVKPKAVQVLPNGKTSILYYTLLSEIKSIYDYIYGEPRCEAFWSDVNQKLLRPTKEYN